MKFFLEYPLSSDADGGAWMDPANITRFAQAAEAAGVDAIALTDHPAPSKKWLVNGGHETLDPFVGLGFIAASTETIQLMTFLTVVPYRNPLLTAKSMTAVDVLSGGRTIFALGTGYLRSEFAALGVDFEERNELFDEAVDVMRQLWATDELHYEGRHFKALGVTLMPPAVQQPHPPLWLGGNAAVVRERVAKWGQGWAPLLGGGEAFTRTTRTRAIASDEDFAVLIAKIKDQMVAYDRDPDSLDVGGSSTTPLPADASVDQRLDALAQLAKIGVTWTHAPLPRSSFGAALDALGQFGEEIIAKAR
ncbi:MAG: LLM class F420-dependent oxidoreductase [Acidimicrobiia bacterium]